jgi:hypothetical protein
MAVAVIPLDSTIHFEIPRDYVHAIPGGPIRIQDHSCDPDRLTVETLPDRVGFAAKGVVVWYRRTDLVRLQVNYQEVVMGRVMFCTLRSVFRGPKCEPGGLETLCILCGNFAHAEKLRTIVDQLVRIPDLPPLTDRDPDRSPKS